MLLALVPGALAVYLAFRAGGYYPEVYSGTVLVLAAGLVVALVASRTLLAGLSVPVLTAATALALLVAWTWFSSTWSEAPWRALFESQRTALYLLALVLCAAMAYRRQAVDWAVAALTGAIFAVCAAALAVRLFPDLLSPELTSVAPTLAPQRLSFPLGYWNGLGAFASIGTVLLLHLSSTLRAPAALRVAGAAGIPVTAATLYFTFSRGAVGAVAVGVAAYLAVGRSRGSVAAVLAAVPGLALTLKQAYSADLLASSQNTTAAAASQGHEVAAWILVAAGLTAVLRHWLIALDARIEGMPRPSPEVRRVLLIGGALAALIAVGAAVALDAPRRVQTAYESFTKSETNEDARDRLRAVTLSGRQEHWEVALRYFRADPLKGDGAGTFETQWFRSRPAPGEASQAHSLYFETLGELGLVGFALVVTAIGALLVGLFRRARGERRAAYGAVFAVVFMWAVHAGVDWDWELTAIGVPLFALAGIALAGSAPGTGAPRPAAARWPVRAAAGLACLVVGVTAVRAVVADSSLDDAKRAFGAGDCRTARSEARSALSAVGALPGAHEIVGWCDLGARRDGEAVREMRAAARLDPQHWRYRYELAIARAAAGGDPAPDVRLAYRLNPVGEMFTKGGALELARKGRGWRRLARQAVAIDSQAAFR